MEIKISKCHAHCCLCNREFQHEQRVHSRAVLQADALKRFDFCEDCRSTPSDEVVFCIWNVRYMDPKVMEAEEQEVFSPLRRLFYDMAGSEERVLLAQAYLAAQLLKRQKVLRQIKESDESESGERITLFLDRQGGRLIETRDLNFTYSELDEARIQLMERLRALESAQTDSAPEAQADGISESVLTDASETGTDSEADAVEQPSDQVEEDVQVTAH